MTDSKEVNRNTVKVLGIKTESSLLNSKPYWCGEKLERFVSQSEVDKILSKVLRLKFPCYMTDTGKKDLFGKRILEDSFGESWSEWHFYVFEDTYWKNK